MNLSTIKKRRGVVAVFLLIFSLGFFLNLSADDNFVLYLKNGALLRCRSYSYEKGLPYKVSITSQVYTYIPEDSVFFAGRVHKNVLNGYELDFKYDSLNGIYIKLPNHFVHQHGFFFQWQLTVVMIDGMRIMMGYRFNNYVALGLGVGAEYGVTLGVSDNDGNPYPNRAPNYVYNSGYSPFYVYLTGDFLKTKATPFYSFELGYNLPWYPHLQTDREDGKIPPPYNYYTNYGGPTAGLGFGCRVYSRRRSNVSISLNMNTGFLKIKTDAFQSYANNNYPLIPIYTSTTSKYLLLQPSLRFSAGF